MRTLLYGGTFDPPHNGHMNNLRAALALVQPDRALVMPAGTPPHKHASATPAELRLQMCACFTALSPAVQVSDWHSPWEKVECLSCRDTAFFLKVLRGDKV